jgi:hypothetical protein
MSYQSFIKSPLPKLGSNTEAETFRQRAKSIRLHFATRANLANNYHHLQRAVKENKKARIAEIAEHYSIEKICLTTAQDRKDKTNITNIIKSIDILQQEYYNLQREVG